MNNDRRKLLEEAHQVYIDIAFQRGSLEKVNQLFSEDMISYGSTLEEKAFSLLEFLPMMQHQQHQMKELELEFELIPASRKISEDENTAIYVDEYKMVFRNNKESYPVFLRNTIIFQYENNCWKIVHTHCSKPNDNLGDKNTLHVKEWQIEKAKLEQLVREKTKDLEQKNQELEIETALERVRAKTMEMHKSTELFEVATLVFQQIKKLNNTVNGTSIVFCQKDNPVGEFWQGTTIKMKYEPLFMEHDIDSVMQNLYNAWKRKELLHTEIRKGEEVEEHFQSLSKIPMFKERLRLAEKAGWRIPLIQKWHSAYFKYGYLQVTTSTPDSRINILPRFASVFEQCYTRFLDLQKAEAQAREAQIEAALERIRAAAMAMHSSEGLSEVAAILREQMEALGQKDLESTLVQLYEKGSDYYAAHYSFKSPNSLDEKLVHDIAPKVPWKESEWSRQVIRNYSEGRDHFIIHADKLMLQEWYAVLEKVSPRTIEYDKEGQIIVPNELYYYFSIFSGGFLSVISYEKPSEETKELLNRATRVFDMAYRRYLDLKNAEEQTRQIEKVFTENQRLLHSILPKQIAEQIRIGQQTIVKRFDQVSILFADIVGFTILSEKISPQEVVDILNGLFSKFDDLTDKYQLEKIKTIGDAYMVAAGVPEEKDNHAQLMFAFAQEMLHTLEVYNQEIGTNLKIRIGISSGPVVAGVIGKKKFAYDLWGDTVNTAARMEAYGRQDCIQVSPVTYNILKEKVDFKKISDVDIKGKGKMDVYLWIG